MSASIRMYLMITVGYFEEGMLPIPLLGFPVLQNFLILYYMVLLLYISSNYRCAICLLCVNIMLSIDSFPVVEIFQTLSSLIMQKCFNVNVERGHLCSRFVLWINKRQLIW